jgi:sec-independent protein translocase protein TatC
MSSIAGMFDGFRARSGDVSFLDRLDQVRAGLIRSLIGVVLTTGLGLYLAIRFDAVLLGIVVRPIEPFLAGEKLQYLNPTDPFFITLKLAVFIGVGLALPYLLIQFWKVLAPLMRTDEKKLVAPALIAGVLLFVAGVVFCYLLALPLILDFTMGFQSETLEEAIVVGDYFSTVLRLTIAFGLAFEMPVAIVLGTMLGVVTPRFLASKRRHAIAAMTIMSALITPPELISQILLLIPLLLLYEVSILLSRFVIARRGPGLLAEA